MIDDTIAARATAKSPHVWTALGERIVGRYTATRPGIYGRMLARPVPLTDDKFVRHSLIRSVLSPYASPSWRARDPKKNAVYFLITELMHLRQNKLHSHDPRLTLDVGIKRPGDRGIVSALLRHGFMDYTVLSEKVSLSGKPLDAALARLLRAGIVMQSVPA
jgi:hypothetical protein